MPRCLVYVAKIITVFVRFLCFDFSFHFVLVLWTVIIFVRVFLKLRPINNCILVLIFATKITLYLTSDCKTWPQVVLTTKSDGILYYIAAYQVNQRFRAVVFNRTMLNDQLNKRFRRRTTLQSYFTGTRLTRREVKKSKRSPYSITERRVPELIPVLGSQPAGDVSHKPDSSLPILSASPAVTPATLKRAATNFAAW